MTATLPHELVGFCRDCFLLARYASTGDEARPEGRAWERAVGGMMWRPGLTRRQHAGTFDLFGLRSASGANHEIDGAGHGPSAGVWVEAKATAALSKTDVATFDLKCRDFYVAAVRHDLPRTMATRWWPVLVSSEVAPDAVRRLCMSHGIVLCEPAKLPLPVILQAVGNAEADLHLPELLMREATRLFEPACSPIQDRLKAGPDDRSINWNLGEQPTSHSLGDAIFIQDELTEDILDYMELEAPGAFETLAESLVVRLGKPRSPSPPEKLGALPGKILAH